MIAERIDELELMEVWYENDPTMRIRVNFPFYVGTGTKSTAVVYFEIEPGCRLGTHTDSAEEILLILEGEAEATVGDERGRVSAGRWRSYRRWSRTPCATWETKRSGWSGSSPATSS
jgi:quercetin dioxygenase-like cupin family protein